MKWIFILFGQFLILLWGCSSVSSTQAEFHGDTLTSEAQYLKIIDCDSFSVVEVHAPWSVDVPIGKYILVDGNSEIRNFPPDYEIIKTPIERSIVFSSVHTSAIDEIGCISKVCGVADGSFFLTDDPVAKLISRGIIKDVGSSLSPLVENIIDLEPQAVLLSPYSGNNNIVLEKTGIPLIWMADYLETTPLGRAEWILLIGHLYGDKSGASTILNNTKSNYLKIKERLNAVADKPKVIVEKPMHGVWYVPGGQSYLAQMIRDAGGDYPWSDDNSSGSISLDESMVLDKGTDADIWLFKDTKPYTSDSFLQEVPHATMFQAYPINLYYCNTLTSPYYNVIAFHPDIILEEMASIFHKKYFTDYTPRFYNPITQDN